MKPARSAIMPCRSISHSSPPLWGRRASAGPVPVDDETHLRFVRRSTSGDIRCASPIRYHDAMTRRALCSIVFVLVLALRGGTGGRRILGASHVRRRPQEGRRRGAGADCRRPRPAVVRRRHIRARSTCRSGTSRGRRRRSSREEADRRLLLLRGRGYERPCGAGSRPGSA